jgi:hypothetical protein
LPLDLRSFGGVRNAEHPNTSEDLRELILRDQENHAEKRPRELIARRANLQALSAEQDLVYLGRPKRADWRCGSGCRLGCDPGTSAARWREQGRIIHG